MEEPIEATVYNNRIRTDVSHIPHSDQVDSHIKPEDIQVDFGEIVHPEKNARVLGTTYRKPKSKLTRFTRKLGKLLHIIPKKNKTTHTHLDFDTTIFENTCLRNVILTDTDVAVLKILFDIYRNDFSELLIQDIWYCALRKFMIRRDNEFLEKYQNISIQYLLSSLTKSHQFIETTLIPKLARLLSKSDAKLKHINSLIRIPSDIQDFIHSMNRTLYTEGPGAEFLGKRGGKKRTKRYRRSKKCRK